MKKFYFSLACLALIGCGDSNTDIVKNATLNFNKTMTIGTAIDNFNDCKSVKWKDTSKGGQNIVTATCEIKKEILKNEFKEKQEAFENKKASNQAAIAKEYETIKKNLQNKCKSDLELPDLQGILELTKKHCELTKRTKGVSFSYLKCEKTISDEINNFNCAPKYTAYNLENLLKAFAYYNAEGEEIVLFETPVEVKSRTYKISFYVNTDKTIDLKDAFVIDDDKELEVSADRMLREFYKR